VAAHQAHVKIEPTAKELQHRPITGVTVALSTQGILVKQMLTDAV
jgi:hypothetical protein